MQSISPQARPAPRWLAGALIGLCTAQPLLDVLSFWTQTLGRATSVSLALRMLLLAAATVLAFVLSERKRAYLILCGVLALFWGAHVLACRRVGYAAPMSPSLRSFGARRTFRTCWRMPARSICT